MLFNSLPFLLLYLPIVVGVCFLLRRLGLAWATLWLAVASIAFIGFWEPGFSLALIVSIVANYMLGNLILRYRYKAVLLAAIGANLMGLAYFKYGNFILENAGHLFDAPMPQMNIILPLGISFFTFTQIAYLVDLYRGSAPDRNFPRYCLFVSYFPHLIAGPILHHSEMLPQFKDDRAFRPTARNIAIGLSVFAIGLFKKVVIADSLSPYVGSIFDLPQDMSLIGAAQAWTAAICYTLQLYFDFSGYSDMAIGLSALMGIKMPINFFSPYKARSLIDFWRRWHISLSDFLKDYLYIPLGGNRLGAKRRLANLMIVMILGGLWHGAAWTYVAWGAFHGIGLVVNHLWRKLSKGSILQHVGHSVVGGSSSNFIVLLFVVFGWVLFRSATLGQATDLFAVMVGANGLVGYCDTATCAIPALPTSSLSLWVMILIGVALFAPNTTEIIQKYDVVLLRGRAFMLKNAAPWQWRPSTAYAVVYSGILIIALFHLAFTKRVSEFLYFQF